jgi:hypothetical protein
MELLRDIHQLYEDSESVEKLVVRDTKAPSFNKLPYQVRETILKAAIFRLFVTLGKMTSRADVITVMTLTAVCDSWRKIVMSRQSNKRYLRRIMEYVVRPYQLHPQLLLTLHGQRMVAGLALLRNKLYIVYDESSAVKVYSICHMPYEPLQGVHVNGLRRPVDLMASDLSNCLYIVDLSSGCVWRVKELDHSVDKWVSVENAIRLSSTTDGLVMVLVAVDAEGRYPNDSYRGVLNIYSPDGELLRIIRLSRDIANPQHAIQTADNLFIVCHGNHITELNRVCQVNVDGDVVNSYGGSGGSRLGQLSGPVYMALDNDGQILVVEFPNRRVILFDSRLNIKRVLLSWTDERPLRIICDFETRRVMFGTDSGKVEVYSIQ